ncbi:MAG: hypothetical protein IIA54_08950, partial [Chloroflexi bacterium]|nr:hypothetical protein [Chloroflexota bacterium]
PTKAPTATPAPPPPPAPTPPPVDVEGVVDIAALLFEDGLIELQIGPNPRAGYEANASIKSNEGDGWVLRLNVGDQLVVGQISQSGSRSSVPHSFTIKELGVNFPLDELEAGGPVAPWKFTFFDEGAFAVTDAHGDDHGTAWILVGDAEIPVGVQPTVYELDEVRIRDAVFELRMGDTTAWGYNSGDRVRTDDGDTGTRDVNDITVTIAVGDSLVFPDGLTSSSSNVLSHFFTIDELGIDIQIPLGEDVEEGFTITPTEIGTFRIYCSAHPDDHGGNFFLVVTLPPAPAVVYELNQIRLRDAAIELRMGDTTAWGYNAGDRVTTADGGDVTITISVGDSLVFPDGFTGSSSNTETHFLTIDELGIDVSVESGNRDTALGFIIAPTAVGTYRVYCSAHPDTHGGNFTLVVKVPGPPPVVYTLNKVRVRDGLFDVRMGDTTAWGYNAGDRVESAPYEGNPGVDVVMTINLGDSIVFESGVDGSNGNAETHFFTIDELGIDIELPPNGEDQAGSNFTITPTAVGTLRLYCSAHPDAHGSVVIVVN